MKLPRVTLAILLLGFFALTGSGWAQSSDDQIPLGDIVKQKPAKKAKVTLTNDDLPPEPPAPPPDANAAPDKTKAAAPAAPAAAPAAQASDKPLTPVEMAQKQLKVAQDEENRLKAKVDALQQQISNATTDADAAKAQAELRLTQNQLNMATATRQGMEQMLADAQAKEKAQQQQAQEAAQQPAQQPAQTAPQQ